MAVKDPESNLLRVVVNGTPEQKLKAVKSKDASTQVLSRALSANPNSIEIRKAVFLRKSLSPDFLALYAKNKNVEIRRLVMRHPNCSQEVLNECLRSDKDIMCKVRAASNPSLSFQGREIAVADGQDPMVYNAAIKPAMENPEVLKGWILEKKIGMNLATCLLEQDLTAWAQTRLLDRIISSGETKEKIRFALVRVLNNNHGLARSTVDRIQRFYPDSDLFMLKLILQQKEIPMYALIIAQMSGDPDLENLALQLMPR